jgi:hypothetical protein
MSLPCLAGEVQISAAVPDASVVVPGASLSGVETAQVL